MAESVVLNKKLLLVAVILGILCVGLFYAYDAAQEKLIRGDTVQVLQWKRSLKAGETVTRQDLETIEVSVASGEFQGVAQSRDLATILDKKVNRAVNKNDWVMLTEIVTVRRVKPSDILTPGYLPVALELDPKAMVGSLMSQEDRVNVYGFLAVKSGQLKNYPLIQDVRIVGVGGVTDLPEAGFEGPSAGDARRRTYTTVVIEIKEDIVPQFLELLRHVDGKVRVAPFNSSQPKSALSGQINPEVLPALKLPVPER